MFNKLLWLIVLWSYTNSNNNKCLFLLYFNFRFLLRVLSRNEKENVTKKVRIKNKNFFLQFIILVILLKTQFFYLKNWIGKDRQRQTHKFKNFCTFLFASHIFTLKHINGLSKLFYCFLSSLEQLGFFVLSQLRFF